MWILTNQRKPEISYVLAPGTSYTIGRVNVNIAILDDASVSRNHGIFHVQKNSKISTYESEVIYQDLGSSFGSYVGEAAIISSETQDTATGQPSQKERLQKGEKATLVPNTRIRLGLLSTIFKLTWKPFVISCSALKEKEKETIRETLKKIGGGKQHRLTSDWCDDVTHLVMKEVTLTIKVANAMAKGVPIIKSDYLIDFLACQNTKQILPNPEQYIPPLGESSLNPSEINLKVMKERQTLFKGKMFAFATQSQMSKVEQCIFYAGGQAIVFGAPDSRFNDPTIFEVPNNLLISPEITALKASPSKRQQIKLWKEAEAVLASNNFKTISVSALALAILHCSTEIHCNPQLQQNLIQKKSSNTQMMENSQVQIDRYKPGASQINTETIVPETQLITQASKRKEVTTSGTFTSCIPETLPLPTPPAATLPKKKPHELFKKPGQLNDRTKTTETGSSSIKKKENSGLITSTPAFTLADSSSFWEESGIASPDKSDDEADGDFWGFSESKKKRKTLSSNTNNSHQQPSAKRIRHEPSEEKAKTSETFDTEVFVTNDGSRKRSRSDDDDDDDEPHSGKRVPPASADCFSEGSRTTLKSDDLIKNSERPESFFKSENSRSMTNESAKNSATNDEITIIDDFGFIGKSFEIKQELKPSRTDDTELSRSFSEVQMMSLVVESSINKLRIRDNNVPESTIQKGHKKFRKQQVLGVSVVPVVCRILEENPSPDFSITVQEGDLEDEPVQNNNLDNWLIREQQNQEEEQTSEEFWQFASKQHQKIVDKKPRKR